jgi:hypothetical protein
MTIPQSPVPNPQSPIPNPQSPKNFPTFSGESQALAVVNYILKLYTEHGATYISGPYINLLLLNTALACPRAVFRLRKKSSTLRKVFSTRRPTKPDFVCSCSDRRRLPASGIK